MENPELTLRATLLYMTLLFPEGSKAPLCRAFYADEEQLQGLLLIPRESLIASPSNFVEGFLTLLADEEQPMPMLALEQGVLSLIDALYDPALVPDRTLRCQLLSTLRTLGLAFHRGYRSDALSSMLQRAYEAYSVLCPVPQTSFVKVEERLFGSWIDADCLSCEDDIVEPTEEQPIEYKTITTRKLPKFWQGNQGREVAYLKAIYRQLMQEPTHPLFTEECTVENFLAMFEGVPGYEQQLPQPIRTGSALFYWGIFLSVLYKSKESMRLMDGTQLNRSAKKGGESDTKSISSVAQTFLLDQNGNNISNAATLNRGSGQGRNNADGIAMERQYQRILTDANVAVCSALERKTRMACIKTR